MPNANGNVHPDSNLGVQLDSESHLESSRTRRKRTLSPRRKLVFGLAAFLLGSFCALLIAELLLRTYVATRSWTSNCYSTGSVFFVPHKTAGYSLRPNLRLKSSSYDVTVNSLGFRGSEIEVTPTRNTTRLAVLGGSSVFGYLVVDNKDSCGVLEDLLNAGNMEQEEHWFEVINAGVPGFNLTQSRLRYEADVAPLKPEFVLLYLGWNDIPLLLAEDPSSVERTPPAPPWQERFLAHSTLYGLLRFRLFPRPTPQFAPPSSATTRVSYSGGEMFIAELNRTIESIREQGSIPVLATQVMAATSENEGLERFLGDSPEQIAANQKIGVWLSDTIRNVAKEQDAHLIDCGADIEVHEKILGDAIHLSEEGHRLVAQSWLEGLLPLLDHEPDR